MERELLSEESVFSLENGGKIRVKQYVRDDKTGSKARLFTSKKSYLNTASNIRKLERAKARGVKSKEVFTHPDGRGALSGLFDK